MGHSSTSDASTDTNDDAAEHLRYLVIEAIEALPANPALLRDLLTMIHFLKERSRRSLRPRGSDSNRRSRACGWIMYVGSWVLWLL